MKKFLCILFALFGVTTLGFANPPQRQRFVVTQPIVVRQRFFSPFLATQPLLYTQPQALVAPPQALIQADTAGYCTGAAAVIAPPTSFFVAPRAYFVGPRYFPRRF